MVKKNKREATMPKPKSIVELKTKEQSIKNELIYLEYFNTLNENDQKLVPKPAYWLLEDAK